MVNIISLQIDTEEDKNNFLLMLKQLVKVPYCTKCGMLFELGFPNNEEGICDYLICAENSLICECENSKVVRNLYSQKKDSLINIEPYYTKK